MRVSETSVKTNSGWLDGAREGATIRWLGVQYAQAKRFSAPTAVKPWEGSKPARAFAPQCPQRRGSEAKQAKLDLPDFGEDCLNLNIWAPVKKGGKLKPVMVWIHGGAFLISSGNPYNGAELAALGDMVVVTINYRLGILGFANFAEAFDLPEIPSNLGLRDQIAALEWVRDNIEAFGGDPGRVTIAGESAGSISVSLLMLCQRAWPLFHGAITQSGAISLIHDNEKSRAIGSQYPQLLGIEPGDINALRQVGVDQLLEAQATINLQNPFVIPAAPWFDGDLLPASLEEALSAPTAPVPLLAGANRDETRRFELFKNHLVPISLPELEKVLRSQLPAKHVQRILAAYPQTPSGLRALASDLTFILPTRHFAERHAAVHPTWFYRFDYTHPILGACHAMELAFIWPIPRILGMLLRGGPMWGDRAALGERMKANWVHFIQNGYPLSDWPAYTSESQHVRLFNLKDEIVINPDAERYSAWAGRDVGPGFSALDEQPPATSGALIQA